MATVRVDGVWLDLAVGPVGGLKWSHRFPKGSWEASWVMDLPPDHQHPALRIDALVEILVGPTIVWGGVLRRPVFNGEVWELVAEGYPRLAERFLCLSAALATSSTPSTVLPEAVSRGLRWTLPSGLSSTAVAAADATNGINYLDTLLDAFCANVSTGSYWLIYPNGLFATVAPPTEPTLHIYPSLASLGVSDDDTGTRVFGRYRSGASTYATVNAEDTTTEAYREQAEDLTERGVITGTVAQNVVDGMLARGASQPSWSNGFEFTDQELTTAGGVPASLPHIGMTPEVARLHGVRNPITPTLGYIDFLIGETEYEDGGTIAITPLNVATGTTLRSALSTSDASLPLVG